jgi:hypothetical protein
MYKALPLTYIICLLLFISSCTSSKKLLESGNHDAAIDKALQSLNSNIKPSKRDEQIAILENAYKEAMSKDRLLVEQLKSTGNDEYWPRVAQLYEHMQRRQDKLAAHLPISYSGGRSANFELWNIHAVKQEARENAAAYHYNLALPYINSNNKSEIRIGFKHLQDAASFVYHYKDVQQLLTQSAARGSNYVYVFTEVGRNFPFIYPAGLVEDFFSKEIRTRSEWLQYDRQTAENRSYDYVIKVILSDLERTPESVRERIRDESKDIEDGWKYVYDGNGNVKKDSSGNDIKVRNMVRVTAQVLETVQSKASRMSAVIEVIYVPTGKLVETTPVYGEAVFSNIAYNYRGDKRALSKETIQKLGNIPVPFPTDDEMILLAREKLRESVYRFIEDREKLFLQ